MTLSLIHIYVLSQHLFGHKIHMLSHKIQKILRKPSHVLSVPSEFTEQNPFPTDEIRGFTQMCTQLQKSKHL